MATTIENGKGGIVSVTSEAQQLVIDDASSGTQLTANHLKVWNEGASTVYAVVNIVAGAYAEASAIPIPAGGSFVFYRPDKPIKNLWLACASGDTSTANYGAY